MDSQVRSLLPELIKLAKAHHVRQLILFGSRARGDGTITSDLDLAVYGAENPMLFNAKAEELPTLLKLDIVHIDANTSPDLLENIGQEGVVLLNKLETKRSNFEKALGRLQEALEEYHDSESTVVRDGMIQRFEFTAELAWKMTREFLLDQGYADINSPKAVMGTAFSDGLIQDEQGWVALLNARNTTSHIYDEGQAAQVAFAIEHRYIKLFADLLDGIRAGK